MSNGNLIISWHDLLVFFYIAATLFDVMNWDAENSLGARSCNTEMPNPPNLVGKAVISRSTADRDDPNNVGKKPYVIKSSNGEKNFSSSVLE